MPWIDDEISTGNSIEISSTDESLSIITHEQAAKHFGVTIHKSPNLSYVPFTLCTSFPNFNEKGRGFSPRVLVNSFASLNGQLVDIEHAIQNNMSGLQEDSIIGYVNGTKCIKPKKLPELASKTSKDLLDFKTPLPVEGLSALFMRAIGVQSIVSDMASKDIWKVSMECNHSWKDAVFFYRNEFIPVMDSPKQMRAGINQNGIRDYNGYPVKVLIGETAGKIDFWGLALTKMPADNTAKVLSLVSAIPREVASSKKFMQIRQHDFREVASIQKLFSGEHEISQEDVENVSEKLIREAASIKVIGYTEPAYDGHKHAILSDLTVVPELGHAHFLKAFNISTGKSAAITAVTETFNRYAESELEPKTHLHLVNIPLQDEFVTESGNNNKDDDMPKTIAEMQKSLKEIASMLTKAPKENGSENQLEVSNKLSELMNEMASIQSEENLRKFFDDTLAKKIESGEIFTKEQASKAIIDAVTVKQEELTKLHEDEKAKAKFTSDREKMILESGIEIASLIPDLKDADGKPITVKQRLDGIELANMTAFTQELTILKKFIVKKPVTRSGGNESNFIPDLAGGGPSGEQASNDKQEKKAPKHMQGKNAFSSIK